MKVYKTLVECCEEAASEGRRQSAETVMGHSTDGPFDTPIGAMLRALARYADDHDKLWGPIADDGYMGRVWEEMLQGVLALLNGERGRIDGGDADGAARAMHRAAGFTGEL
jgi:hypothetical protein